MTFQTQVNKNLALGVVGEYADDSPHREAGYILLSRITTGVAATGSLTATANPDDGDTVTIANITYRFKSTMAAANDVKIGANLGATLTSLVKTVNGTGTAGTDNYTGTKDLATILTASVSSSTVTLTANEAGIVGNYYSLASSDANIVASAFAGGVDAVEVKPQIACAFTHTTTDGQAMIGGTNAFAGVLVEPKQFANYQGLNATLELPNGIQGGLCTFGHIFVKPASAFAPGYVAAYNNANGAINAYDVAGNIPAGFTQIANAKFIKVSGNANDTAILQLGD